MEQGRTARALLAFGGMLILILDANTALQGAREGVAVCIRTAIPSLFPFLLLSTLITSSLAGRSIWGARQLRRLLGLPAGTEGILINAFLGGYPMGAQSIADMNKRKRLTVAQSRRLSAFCSNAGPGFIFGMAASQFPSMQWGWLLWGAQILSALLVAMLLPAQKEEMVHGAVRTTPTAAPGGMDTAVRTMAVICGWIVIFRIVVAFLRRWLLWLLPEAAGVLLIGLLELTNGCCELEIVEDIPLRFVLCAAMLSFGGSCVLMQTASILKEIGVRYYLLGKLLQTLICVVLCSLFVWNAIALGCLLIVSVGYLLEKKNKNKGRIPCSVGV